MRPKSTRPKYYDIELNTWPCVTPKFPNTNLLREYDEISTNKNIAQTFLI